MNYRKMHLDDVLEMHHIWEQDVVGLTIYKSLSMTRFSEMIFNAFFDEEGSVVVTENEDIIGYGVGYKTSDDPNIPGFIGLIVVKTSFQRQKIGSEILKRLELYLKNAGKKVIRNYFASPLNIEWVIPQTNHYHTGAPAIPFNSAIYYLLQNNGYVVNGQLDGYHLDLARFVFPSYVMQKLEENETEGYKIEIYDHEKHQGLASFFDCIKNPNWKKIALENEQLNEPKPMLVAVKDHQVVGWTGPLSVTSDLKGSFGGIGIDPEARSRGLGKTLFVRLCDELKHMGATYMTLFTGSDNVARNIYLYAGFHLVHSFSILKKDLT